MDEVRWPRKLRAGTVGGRQGRGRPMFGWLDGVKRALAVRVGQILRKHNILLSNKLSTTLFNQFNNLVDPIATESKICVGNQLCCQNCDNIYREVTHN